MTDQRDSGLGAHLSTELAITADEAVRRLSARVLAMSKRTGSFDRRFIGHFADRRFTIRVASWLPSPYFPRAVGEVRDGASGARLEVRFQQDPLGRARPVVRSDPRSDHRGRHFRGGASTTGLPRVRGGRSHRGCGPDLGPTTKIQGHRRVASTNPRCHRRTRARARNWSSGVNLS